MTILHRGLPGQQFTVKPGVKLIPLRTGGNEQCFGQSWRMPVSANVGSQLMPLLETYLLNEHQLPWEFVSHVADVASEAFINAGKYGRPETEVQVTCYVAGQGLDRRCTVKVYNLAPDGSKKFPKIKEIPEPDLGVQTSQVRSRGLPIIKARADAIVLEDLPGPAKEVTMSFDLNRSIR